MFKQLAYSAVILATVGCGGGGGRADDDLQFGSDVPSETTLCSFIIGVTTRDQIEAVLGEPENFHDTDSGTSVQYWYGDAAMTFDLKILLVSYDDAGIFESALTTQIQYPQCWRDREQDKGDGSSP